MAASNMVDRFFRKSIIFSRALFKNYQSRIGNSSKKMRPVTELQVRDELTTVSKNPQLKMAVEWERHDIGKTCSDLFPRCSNKVRFTIGQQLFRAAIASKTRGRNDGTISSPRCISVPFFYTQQTWFSKPSLHGKRYFWLNFVADGHVLTSSRSSKIERNSLGCDDYGDGGLLTF